MPKINLPKYLEWLEKRNLSPETIKIYSWFLQKYIKQKHGEFNANSIASFLKENLRYEPNSLKVLRSCLISYAKFKKLKVDWELVAKLIPTTQQKFFPTINETELERLKQVQIRTSYAINQRNNLILDFLFWTGIRVSELINIRHCDYQNESLWIKGKGNKIRYVFVPEFLAPYFNGSSDYLFKTRGGTKISKIQVYFIIRRKAEKIGLGKNISPHTFRRSFATLLNNRDCKMTAIQKFLGHSQLSTTANYIHNSREELYQEYSKLWKNPLNSTPPPPQHLF